MFFRSIRHEQLGISSFILGDEKTKKCLVIDPMRHVVPYIISAQNSGYTITDILETHVHADFVSGAKELKHELNDKPNIWASGMGGKEWVPLYADRIVEESTHLHLGSLHLRAIHTPGHTPEHVSWVCFDDSRSLQVPWFIFTGDSLFVGGVGRPDLIKKEVALLLANQLYDSLFTKLGEFPDFVEIYPSHGSNSLCGKISGERESSTLGYERLFNPYLKRQPKEAWIANLFKDLPTAPPYFSRLKQLNVSGPQLLNSLKTFQWDFKNSQDDLEKLFLIDIRPQEVFAASYLKGSINIPFNASFCKWAGFILPFEKPLGLIVESQNLALEVIENLRLMGFDQQITILFFDAISAVKRLKMDSFKVIEIDKFKKKSSKEDSLLVLDVRTSSEWDLSHITGAIHIDLVNLENCLDQLPKEKSIVVVCQSGARASLAASLLKKNHFCDVMNLRGGMVAWKQSSYRL